MVKRRLAGRKSTVHTEDTATNQGTNGHPTHRQLEGAVEGVAVTAATLVGKAIVEVDRLRFVVSSQQDEVVRIFDLICEK